MRVDYLIAGAGASGMAFLDVILAETDATVAVVDRRDVPGGHWNDAYPFVRLHQSSSFYGVPSTPLGQDRLTPSGYNAGMFELATKHEILHYYQDLMETKYLASGRVHYFPMSEHLGDGVIRSLVSGDETEVEIGKTLVNAGVWGDRTTIPLNHTRSFGVDGDVTCVPPNDLPRRAPQFDRYTVLGAGKTAMDAVLWLLSRAVRPEHITWVRPSEYWLYQRDSILPHRDFFFKTMTTTLSELESLASATSTEDHFANLEACGLWHRIDQTRMPTKFHAAVCSAAEVAALRQIKDVVRAGHVTQLHADRMVLTEAQVETPKTRLYVDCTAHGGAILPPDTYKVFDEGCINLLMVRPFQPLFSAALIAHIEATIPDHKLRQACTQVTNFHDTPIDYLAVQRQGMMNQAVWGKVPEIKDWIDGCRLNAASHLMAGITPHDTDKLALLGRIGPASKAAMENISRLIAPAAS